MAGIEARSITLQTKLDAAIKNQQAEVTRLEQQSVVDLELARVRLAQLQEMAKFLTPELEAAFIIAKKLGLKLDD